MRLTLEAVTLIGLSGLAVDREQYIRRLMVHRWLVLRPNCQVEHQHLAR